MGIQIDESDLNPKDRCGTKKVSLYLCSPRARIEWAKVMAQGAEDYGEYNWRMKKVRLSIYLDAIDRHNLAMMDGEMIDPKSGCMHAGHVMACGSIIIDAYGCEAIVDDRFIHDGAAVKEMARLAGAHDYEAERLRARQHRSPCPTYAQKLIDDEKDRAGVEFRTSIPASVLKNVDKRWRNANGKPLSQTDRMAILDYESGGRSKSRGWRPKSGQEVASARSRKKAA